MEVVLSLYATMEIATMGTAVQAAAPLKQASNAMVVRPQAEISATIPNPMQ